MTTSTTIPFRMERLGIIMQADAANPQEAWGVLNPAGVRGPDGDYYLFPRVVAEGNFSRIGVAKVNFDGMGQPTGVTRLGYALEPREDYEVTRVGGGVEDPRVTHMEALGLYIMTYTAYVPHHPRIAVAVSSDLVQWRRLGLVQYAPGPDGANLNESGNKDGLIFPEVVPDPRGRPSIGLIHRPTYAMAHSYNAGGLVTTSPSGSESKENIWISYVPFDEVEKDITALTRVSNHQVLMHPEADWEMLKVGGGAPPVRLPYGWLLLYHGVSGRHTTTEKVVRYCAGAAILSLDDPTKVLYRSPEPILAPELRHETQGIVPGVVFPTATDRRDGAILDVYYGGADSIIAAARLTIPDELPVAP